MGIYKIDGMGIKTSVFTILASCLVVFYFGNCLVFLRFCKTRSIGGSTKTLQQSYIINIVAFCVSLLIFLYTFISAYFFKRLLSNTVYNSNLYKVIGMFIFSLFVMVICFINAQIFDTARKSGLDAATAELLYGMLWYSIVAGLFVLFYMVYYVYNNVLRFNTHFKNIVLKIQKKENKSGKEEMDITSDDEIASVSNLNKFRELALKKRKDKKGEIESVDPFDEGNDIFDMTE